MVHQVDIIAQTRGRIHCGMHGTHFNRVRQMGRRGNPLVHFLEEGEGVFAGQIRGREELEDVKSDAMFNRTSQVA